ncbi:MAG: response regulator transcription factor, partial [Burkholderiales bacterium]
MKRNIRVLIVDDHAMMRLGLAEAIAGEPDMVLAGE